MLKKLFAALAVLLCLAACACLPQGTLAQEELRTAVEFDEFRAFVPEGSGVRFRGKLAADRPISKVVAECYEMRSLEKVGEHIWQAEEGAEPVYQLDLYPMRKDLFPSNKPGDYRVVITVESGEDSAVALDRRIFIGGDQLAPRNMNADCTFDCEEMKLRHWSDGRVVSRWQPGSAEEVLTVTLPQGRAAEGIAVNWYEIPRQASIRCLDASGALLLEHVIDESTFTPLHAWYPLPEETASVQVSIAGGEAAISELLVIEQDKRAQAVQLWRETAEKWDMMLVSTHQDDEHLFFGGMISQTVARGKEIGLVYMADCGRDRYTEALDGLWAAGMDNYPVFMGYRDSLTKSKSSAYKLWDGEDAVVGALVEQIRKYRPEVVVTHDFNGEYEHNQHKVTAECVTKAVFLAHDPSYQPETAEQYGVWTVKKLYIHLYEEQVLTLDWDAPIEGFGGMTGYDISQMCYSFHRSQQELVRFSLGLSYDPESFGLYYTVVGLDSGKGDLFENID